MGSLYLLDLAAVCRSTGYPVFEVEGWTSRARGSGGYSSPPSHQMVHHTASGPSSDGWDDVNYICYGDDDAPLSNLYIGRRGEIWVCAAGATNTNGSGQDPCGHIADDTMNSSAVGIEAGNNGVGEAWPPTQLAAYTALCSALCAAYGIPTGRIHAHFEWAPARKVDPVGPAVYATGAQSWDMDAFRADCATGPAPTPEPSPPDEEDDDVKLYIVKDPVTNGQYVTDMATFKTPIPSPGVANEGRDMFGWQTFGDTGIYYPLGAGWAPFLDQLPVTEA